MKVAINTGSMHAGSLARGVGAYTRQLVESLHASFPGDTFTTVSGQKPTGFDLVHYPFFDPYYFTLPLHYAVPTVITIHDLIPLKYPTHFPVGSRGHLAWWWERFRAQRSAAIITDSNSSAGDIERLLHLSPSRIFVIPLAPATARTSYALSPKLKKLYSLPDRYILYVGDINWNKNVPGLISAFAQLPASTHLVLVGKVFESKPDIPEYQAVDSAITNSGAASRIHTLGYVPSHHLGAIYHAATIYCQPSFDEGFGLPLLEAMKAGCPVVSSNGGSLPEVGGNAVAYFDPHTNELGRVLSRLLSSSQERERLIQAGLQQVKRFSWTKTAELTHKVYEHVLT